MRHQMAGRTLGRNASHRLAMFRNMAASLIQHERIVTTVEKAKELRPFIEKLITLAKKDTLHAKRLVIARLGPAAKAPFFNAKEEMLDQSAFTKLFADLAPRFADRPGGYTRILKRHERRLGDAGRTAFIELLQAGETKPERKKKAAPAQAPAPAPEAE